MYHQHYQRRYYPQSPLQWYDNQPQGNPGQVNPIQGNPAQGNPFGNYYGPPKMPQNPYNLMQQQPKPPKQGLQNLLYHFQTQDGQLDFEKMFNTANQVSQTVKQISPLFQLFYPKK